MTVSWLEERTIYRIRHGSHAYGLNIASSDEDFKGVCIPPKEYFLGFLNNFEQAVENKDSIVYDLRKFMRLAADCNPSIIEVLFVDKQDILVCDKYGDILRTHATEFLSQKAKHTFSGYAIAQLKRIKTHHEWLLNPPKAPPDRKEFGLSEETKISASEMGVFEAQGEITLSKDLLTIFLKEKQYKTAKTHWGQYQNWLNTRNPARAGLEAKYGYDTKHGMHLVRLMRMGKEILTTGQVLVKRPDRDELLSIRNGDWPYDKLVGWAEEHDAELKELKSPLPHSPDRNKLDTLCCELVSRYNS